MVFTKEQLYFISLYNSCKNKETNISDKTNLQSKGNKFYFFQYTPDIKFITAFDKKDDGIDFNKSYETQSLNYLVNSFNDNDITFDLDIENNIIKFNNSEYSLSNYIYETDFPAEYIEIYENGYDEKFVVEDISKIINTKLFMSKIDNNFDNFTLMNNHFVSFNRTILSVLKTQNKIDETLCFPSSFIDIIKFLKEYKNIEIRKLQGGQFYSFKIHNTYVFLDIKNNNIPDIFDPEIRKKFEHNSQIVVKKENILNCLNRLKTVSINNPENRILVEIQNNKMILKSIDSQKAQEIVELESLSKDLNGLVFLCSSFSLYDIIYNIKESDIYIELDNDDNLQNIKITNEGNTIMYVLVLLKKMAMDGIE